MGPTLYSPYAVKHCVDTHAHRAPMVQSSGKGLDSYITIYNDSHRSILTKDRFGVTTFMKPLRQYPGRGEMVVIQLQWQLDVQSIKYTAADLEKRYPRPTPLISCMLHAFRDALQQPPGISNTVKTTPIWIDVPLVDIQDGGGKLYIAELDITLAFEEGDNSKVDHPQSPAMRARQTVGDLIPAMGQDTMTFVVKAVDNAPCKSREDRFIWIGNDVYHIPVEYDQSMPEGIHVICQPSATRKNEQRTGQMGPSVMHYSFEEADLILGLSTTVEGAKHRGNSKEALTEQLNRATLEGKLEELRRMAELNTEKYRRETERLEFEAKQTRLKHQREMEKAGIELDRLRFEHNRREQDYRKAEQDSKRDDVRGFTEWLRVIGGVISAGVALAALAQKIKTA